MASGVVIIVATTDEGGLVLVEQPRMSVHQHTIELPAGLVGDQPSDADEPMERAAERELEEETGFHAATWTRLFAGPPSVGLSGEMVTFFRATGLTRIAAGGGDASEQITVHVIPLDDVPAFLAAQTALGALVDPKVYAGLYFVHAERRGR
jgi:ADP-ribose pyrophosphatase